LPEAKALFAETRLRSVDASKAGFESERDEVLAEQPDNAIALSLLWNEKPEERLALTSAAAARHPADSRLQMLAWADTWRTRAQRGTPDLWVNSLWFNVRAYIAEGPPPPNAAMDALLDRAAQLAPDRPVIQMALAASLLARKDPRSARAGLQALRAYSNSARLADLVARALAGTGHCGEAAALGEQALAMHLEAERNGIERHNKVLPLATEVDLQEKLERHQAFYLAGCTVR
jgi:hypothetical protein